MSQTSKNYHAAKRKRILILSDVANHCFGHRARALQRYAPTDLEFDVIHYDEQDVAGICWANYDLIFCLPTWLGLFLRKLFRMSEYVDHPPLVVSHNSGIGRRTDQLLESIVSADWVVVNNYAVWAAWQPQVKPQLFNCSNISNGVDLDIFHRRPHESDGCFEGPPPTRVLWTATTTKVEDPDDVKGYRTIKLLEELLGNMPEFHADFRVVDPGQGLDADGMAEWYSGGDIVVCASHSEGTPNIMLEGMGCGCVPVTTAVGNVPEIIRHKQNGWIVDENNVRGFLAGLRYVRENLLKMRQKAIEDIKSWDWSKRSRWFYQLFRRIMAGNPIRPNSYLHEDPTIE
jgi:hypothetical protein